MMQMLFSGPDSSACTGSFRILSSFERSGQRRTTSQKKYCRHGRIERDDGIDDIGSDNNDNNRGNYKRSRIKFDVDNEINVFS